MDEAVFMNTSVLNLSIMGDTCNLRSASESSIFLYIVFVLLTGQERGRQFSQWSLDSSPWGSTSQKGMNVLTCRTHFFPKYSL
jgi:hypothetical protein